MYCFSFELSVFLWILHSKIKYVAVVWLFFQTLLSDKYLNQAWGLVFPHTENKIFSSYFDGLIKLIGSLKTNFSSRHHFLATTVYFILKLNRFK